MTLAEQRELYIQVMQQANSMLAGSDSIMVGADRALYQLAGRMPGVRIHGLGQICDPTVSSCPGDSPEQTQEAVRQRSAQAQNQLTAEMEKLFLENTGKPPKKKFKAQAPIKDAKDGAAIAAASQPVHKALAEHVVETAQSPDSATKGLAKILTGVADPTKKGAGKENPTTQMLSLASANIKIQMIKYGLDLTDRLIRFLIDAFVKGQLCQFDFYTPSASVAYAKGEMIVFWSTNPNPNKAIMDPGVSTTAVQGLIRPATREDLAMFYGSGFFEGIKANICSPLTDNYAPISGIIKRRIAGTDPDMTGCMTMGRTNQLNNHLAAQQIVQYISAQTDPSLLSDGIITTQYAFQNEFPQEVKSALLDAARKRREFVRRRPLRIAGWATAGVVATIGTIYGLKKISE